MKGDLGYIRSLDESFQDTLLPGALIVGLAYTAIGIIHWSMPRAGLPFLGPTEVFLGVSTLVLFAFLRRWKQRGERFSVLTSRILGAAIVAPVLVNNALYLNIRAEPQHAFGFYILLVGTGMIPFTARWYASIAGTALFAWGLSVLRSDAPLEAFVEPGVTILAMTALGTAMHVWRFRYAERMDSLREDAARSHEARAAYEARYRDMAEQANDMITELDCWGRVLYANPAHEVVLGIKPTELVGHPYGDFLIEDDVPDDLLSLPPHTRLLSVRHADGTPRIVESNIRVFDLESGEKRILVTTRDMTERVASERRLEAGHVELSALVEERTAALKSSLRALRKSDRLASMGTLAAGIAHQINNPVGSIQMSAELALLNTDAEDRDQLWREALENNLEQAKRCGRIVSSMLQFARNEPTEKTPHELTKIVRRVCGQSESYARSNLATIDISGIEGPLPVCVSSIEIEQALLNIVRNATESSTNEIYVEVSTYRQDQMAHIEVRDNGRGMEPTEVEHAFDPFFTTRLNRGGTGLGLSVAHGVITDHGGTISIESKPDIGTTVTIRIPLEIDLAASTGL